MIFQRERGISTSGTGGPSISSIAAAFTLVESFARETAWSGTGSESPSRHLPMARIALSTRDRYASGTR